MKYILYTFFSVITLTTTAQNNAAKTPKSPKQNPHLAMFNVALTSGDIISATAALNYYISEQGDNNVFTDTLAMMYLQQGMYNQAYYWSDKRLKVKPDDTNLLEIYGACLDKLQQPKEAIDVFEKLFKKTQNPYHGYKLLELQYNIKRLNESLETAFATEKLVFKPEYTITYSFGEQVGRTYLQAGVYNIHALALFSLDKKQEAKAYFEKAIALDTTFALAKQNLQTLLTLEQQVPPVNETVPVNNSPAILNNSNKQK